MFPRLDKIIWIDTDTLVNKDIQTLWDISLSNDELLAAVPRRSPSYGGSFKNTTQELFKERYGITMKGKSPTFNAGVFVMNLRRWRDDRIVDEALYWMEAGRKEHLWNLGTQPIMLLALYEKWQHLPRTWNHFGLGVSQEKNHQAGWWSIAKVTEGSILHFNGPLKPWSNNAKEAYKPIYQQYAIKKDAECEGLSG